jgi:hypothetical protein
VVIVAGFLEGALAAVVEIEIKKGLQKASEVIKNIFYRKNRFVIRSRAS